MSRKEYEDLDGPIGKRDQGYTATHLEVEHKSLFTKILIFQPLFWAFFRDDWCSVINVFYISPLLL